MVEEVVVVVTVAGLGEPAPGRPLEASRSVAERFARPATAAEVESDGGEAARIPASFRHPEPASSRGSARRGVH